MWNVESGRVAGLVCLVLATAAAAASGGARSNEALGIDVTLPTQSHFYIPVVSGGRVVGVVPLGDSRYVGVRFLPRLTSGGVAADVALLLANQTGSDLGGADSAQMMRWPSKDLGTYSGGKGTTFDLSAKLKALNLAGMTFVIVAAHPAPVAGSSMPFFEAPPMKGAPPRGSCLQLGPVAIGCWE